MREQLVINRFRDGQIALLPPAVTFTEQTVSEAEDTGRVLFEGQLIRGKGVDLLLDAMELTDSAVTLDIVGTGNDEQMLRDRVSQSALRDRVTFHGWMDHEALMRFYDRAMISVVPSRWPEPFGMVGLEAMLRKRPVVAFAVGGIPDWLEDGVTGYLVPEADTKSMAKRIDELASDISLVRSMGEAGLRHVNEEFDFSRYIVHLEQILKGEEI
jgi:glycosyltransferase involved in cell wall biosynthesis